MGTYVSKLDPESFSLGINDAMEEVTLQIAEMKTFANNAYTLLITQLNDLKSGFSNPNLPGQPVDYNHVSEVIEAGEVGHEPTRPNFEEEFAAIRAETRPTKGSLIPLSMPIFPTIPPYNITEPTATFHYNEAAYHSALATALQTSLMDILSDDGEAYATTITNAIYTKNLTRLSELAEQALTETMGFFPSRGWNMPNLNQMALVERANIKFDNAVEDLIDKVAELEGTLKLEFRKFGITAATQYETVLRDFHNKVADRTLDAAKTTVLMIYDIFTKKVEAYRVRMEGVRTEVDAKKAILDAQIAYNKGITDIYVAEVTGYDAILRALLGVIDAEAKVYATEGSVFGEFVKLELGNLNAKVERLRALIAQASDKTGLQIKEAEVNLQAYLQAMGLSADVSKAIATILAQIVASALGAVNTNLGKSDDVNRSVSEAHSVRQSISNTLSESHTDSDA